MTIQRAGSQPSTKGPDDYFTGTVRIDPLFAVAEPSRVSAALVTFEPCARSAWHTHPLGQRLIITVGCGRIQRWGGPIEEMRPGDVIVIAPGEKHWHGAAPTTAMSHIAVQEALDGKKCRLAREGDGRTVSSESCDVTTAHVVASLPLADGHEPAKIGRSAQACEIRPSARFR